jgi:hypothetical protein
MTSLCFVRYVSLGKHHSEMQVRYQLTAPCRVVRREKKNDVKRSESSRDPQVEAQRPKARTRGECNLPPLPCPVAHSRAASPLAIRFFFGSKDSHRYEDACLITVFPISHGAEDPRFDTPKKTSQ